jgi:hypothetical protein
MKSLLAIVATVFAMSAMAADAPKTPESKKQVTAQPAPHKADAVKKEHRKANTTEVKAK